MNTPKAIVIVAAIISICGVIGYYLHLENNRYEITTSSKGIAYQVDKKTGESWVIRGDTKVPHESPKPSVPAAVMPYSESSKVTGRASLSYGYFKGNIYNGSSWNVSEFTVELTVKEKDGSVRWSRRYKESISLPALQTKDFIFQVTGDAENGDLSWGITEVKGYAP
ncbi:MAG: hypothetical protein O3B01_08600 [Planctomycetota bacterium]|nr:hypothetical protein [Planctomycetota bacterium]